MSTFHAWLVEQDKRQDRVGGLARLWQQYDHPKYSGLGSVVKSLQQKAQAMTGRGEDATWMPEAIDTAVREYRGEKAPDPEQLSTQSARLAAIEEKLEMLLRGQQLVFRALGIDGRVTEQIITDAVQAARDYDAAAQNGADSGVTLTSQLAGYEPPLPVTDVNWAALYGLADHAAEE